MRFYKNNFTLLKQILLITIILSSIILIYNLYQNYIFNKNPLSHSIKKEIDEKRLEILQKINQYYGIRFNPTLIISNKMPHNIYGLSTYANDKTISVILNKKRFLESKKYMINTVMPHEYAHAMMFKIKDFSYENAGHTKQWQSVCLQLGGLKCDRFVNYHDIAINKAKPWK